MMKISDSQEVLEGLQLQNFEHVEVFHKLGRSRTFHDHNGALQTSTHHEEGHSIRAGDRHRAFFAAASGPPRLGTEWPRVHHRGLQLPSPSPVPPFEEASELSQRLLGEGEAKTLIQSLRSAVASEFPGAIVTNCCLADGTSESSILNTRGVQAGSRQRTASLLIEARAGRSTVTSMQALRTLRHVDTMRQARSIADRLTIAKRSHSVSEERGHCLLAPAVTAALLSALRPLWIGPEARSRAQRLTDARGRFAASSLTLIDDPRLAEGLLSTACDGEGSPTRRVVLVDRGRFEQPILAWNHHREPGQRWSGCHHRAGWRDVPTADARQLFLQPDPSVGTAQLLTELRRGFYAIAPGGPARVSADCSRFTIPISGYLIGNGAATGCFDSAWLSGRVPTFFHGVIATARDLEFFAHGDSLFGAPTLWVRGLRLTSRAP